MSIINKLMIFLAAAVMVVMLPTSTRALPIQIFEDLGDHWDTIIDTQYSYHLNPRLKITESSVSGFSNGARWAANIMAVEPHLFRASAILGGQIPKQLYGNHTFKLKEKKIFIYQGTEDYFLTEETLTETSTFFQKNGANVTTMHIHGFHHVLPNALPVNPKYNPQKSCGTIDDVKQGSKNSSMARNCGFNIAYYFLKDWFDARHSTPMNRSTNAYSKHGHLLAFNQTPFTEKGSDLAEVGYVYLPDTCLHSGEFCSLHVHIHGCQLSSDLIRDVYLRQTGLLEFAAMNHIVLLFPQVGGQGGKDIDYCWKSAETHDKYDSQLWAIQKMMSALILFEEDDDLAMQMQPVTSLTRAVEQNWQDELISKILKLNEDVMLL